MKVLMMVSWYSPLDAKVSIGIFHYELAIALQKYCDIAIYYPYDRNIKKSTHKFENGIDVYRSKYKLQNKIRNRLNMFRTMAKIKKEFKPDIIHAQVATEVGRFAVILGKLFRIPVVITEHSTVEASEVESFPHYYYGKFAYKYSRYNICVSENLSDRLSRIFPDYVFHTIYNGIVIPVDIEDETLYRVPGCTNMILVASLYDKEIKGIPLLFRVIKRIKKENYKIRLHIVGDGEFLEEFKNLAISLDIEEECIFHGRFEKSRVYAIVNQMDFLVSASKFESFGCSIAEALVLGKPVVATKCGGPESIVTPDSGILVDKEDEQALYEGIIKMMQTYEQYDTDHIMRSARERFDIDNVAYKYLNIFKNIV